jgi:hypothetical protein
MALKTLGTGATTSLRALVMNSNLSVADAATLRANIKDDLTNGNPIWPGGFEMQGGSGLLYVPNRGVLKVLPGDYVAYDADGWPILVSKAAIAFGSTSWSHS